MVQKTRILSSLKSGAAMSAAMSAALACCAVGDAHAEKFQYPYAYLAFSHQEAAPAAKPPPKSLVAHLPMAAPVLPPNGGPLAARASPYKKAAKNKDPDTDAIPAPTLIVFDTAEYAPVSWTTNTETDAQAADSSGRITLSAPRTRAQDILALLPGPTEDESEDDEELPAPAPVPETQHRAQAASRIAYDAIPAPRLVVWDGNTHTPLPGPAPAPEALNTLPPIAGRRFVQAAAIAPVSQSDVPAPRLIDRSAPSDASPQPDNAIVWDKRQAAAMLLLAQQSTLKSASLAGAQARGTALAYNDAALLRDPRNLNDLAPAAGMPSLPNMSVMPPAAAPFSALEKIPVPPPSASAPSDDADPAALAEMNRKLSEQSRAIVDRLPPEKTRSRAKPSVSIAHEQANPLDKDEVRKHNGVGISISVKRPKPNVNHMLEEAYDDLIAGDQEAAIALYRNVLEDEPRNKLALFGLATTYHRAGQLNMARPLYGKLLAIDPKNEEGLNNFLVLLSDESPEEALEEMKKLERTHPDFSPLPAQMAVIYEKMGRYEEAVASMTHAIELSPENIKYRYDMAVILDKMGDWRNASVYYQQLIAAEERGEKIPAKSEEIQERLTFIRSNRPRVY